MTGPIADPTARAASAGSGAPPAEGFALLVPELSVSEIGESLRFWCGALGFAVAYDRPAARFAFLALGPEGGPEGTLRPQVMLCERNGGWETGGMARPFGRGINLQIAVPRLAPLLEGLAAAGWPLYRPPAEAWYRTGPRRLGGQREFLVQDPDGYLLRFAEDLGEREG